MDHLAIFHGVSGPTALQRQVTDVIEAILRQLVLRRIAAYTDITQIYASKGRDLPVIADDDVDHLTVLHGIGRPTLHWPHILNVSVSKA
jgi:hypothetical protein